jgi:hypothetical protein
MLTYLAKSLDFSNVAILQRVDALALLLDLLANRLWNQFDDQIFQLNTGSWKTETSLRTTNTELTRGRPRTFATHDLHHLASDFANLGRLRVRRLLDLIRAALREADGEQTQHIAVRRLHVDKRLDQRLPLAHQRARLVGRQLHAVERRQQILALHVVAVQLHLSVR